MWITPCNYLDPSIKWRDEAVMDSRVTIQPRLRCIPTQPIGQNTLKCFPLLRRSSTDHVSPNFQRFWPCYTAFCVHISPAPPYFLTSVPPIHNKLCAMSLVHPRIIQILNVHFLLDNEQNELEIWQAGRNYSIRGDKLADDPWGMQLPTSLSTEAKTAALA